MWMLSGKLIENVEEIDILGNILVQICHILIMIRSVFRHAAKQCSFLDKSLKRFVFKVSCKTHRK